ncbi:DUF3987 domain-containing protein [Fulvivirga sp. M361]|uniref:DUF3987 domain-containing protein n=1 Tax=Fulvivirga sp. M361 TaxID=2594266 RepID=UPI00117B497A|nr:DUF3987 domain-containing protein [Fulvivirga sp. M361]TRX51881.1 DUF3987 domain-containing protein [Fulvivirga sp. M361]
MERKTFNPLEWLDKPEQQTKVTEQTHIEITTSMEEVERIIQYIESNSTDITSAYSDWVNIGFAFADEFGESGRNLFHRISQFYPDYSSQECDKQFDNCLKANGQGVSLKTFFYHAKQAGIPLASPRAEPQIRKHTNSSVGREPSNDQITEVKNEPEQMPTFPKSLFPELPEFLQKVVQVDSSDEERDILLLGSLAAISACLPKVSGIYDGKRVYANLFLFITAQASAGKGRLVHCRQLVNPVHKEFREQAKAHKQHYELELAEYNANKGKVEGIEKPAKPPEKMLFIPANNSSTGAYQLLGDSDGKGLIFETEGDTLAHAFKSDYGNYSDGFRKAFHHETISYYRRTDREYVDIESPCLSTVLSGTPKQVSALIPNAENGLFSRFIFYYMNVRPVWKNVFASQTTNGLDDYFDALGNDFFTLYSSLKMSQDVQFFLTADQQDQFNAFFGEVQDKYMSIQGIDYMATIRRLGLIAYRFCMIFSALRIMETGETSSKMICEERDFQTALAMIRVLIKHSSKVFSELPEDAPKPKRLNRKEKFLSQLPKRFNRQKYLETATSLNIPHKTAEGYITDFCKSGLIHRESQDNYINTSIEDVEDIKEIKEDKA